MSNRIRRTASAWFLLSIFVSMTVLSTFHFHEASDLSAAECVDCAHHLHHSGHFTAGGGAAHDCLLCQFLSLAYIVPATAALVVSPRRLAAVAWPATLWKRLGASRVYQGRAPPFLS